MHTLPKRALAVACAAALLGTGTSALAAESVPASARICPSLTPHLRRGTAAPSCLCAPCLRPWGPR